MKIKGITDCRWVSSLWIILVGGFIFRSLIAYFLPVGFDEAYYFLYSRHLNWSYFDHPLAVAWSAGSGLWLTGYTSPFTVRLGALTLFTGSLWLLYATGRQLFGHKVGLLSSAIASLCPLFFLSFGTLVAPDNVLIFFWSLALYGCSKEFFPKEKKTYQPTPKLVWISLALGLCCLSKYHGFLLGLSLVAFCSTHRIYRSALTSKWLWVGAVVFAIVISPIFYWNAQHNWISFRFQLGDRFAEYDDLNHSGYSISALLGVIGAQIGYLFPSIALPLWWTTTKAAIQQVSQKTRIYDINLHQANKISFVLWSGLPTATAFILIGGATHTFPAWPAPGLWSLTLLLGQAASHWNSKKVYRWLQMTGWIIGLLLLFALSHLTLGTLQKPSEYALFGGVISAQDDPSTQLIDVVQLRKLLGHSKAFKDAIAQSSFIVTNKYWLSGYFAMAMPPEISKAVSLPVTSFTVDPRGHAFWFNQSNWKGKDALLISLADTTQAEFLSELGPYFEKITPLTEIATQRGGENSEIFYLYQASNLIKPYPYPY